MNIWYGCGRYPPGAARQRKPRCCMRKARRAKRRGKHWRAGFPPKRVLLLLPKGVPAKRSGARLFSSRKQGSNERMRPGRFSMNAKRASSVRDGVGGMHHRGFVTCVVAAAWLTTGLLPGAVVASDDPGPAWHHEETTLKDDRADLEQRGRARIQGFLDRGGIPIIDLASSLPERDANNYLVAAIRS